MGASMGAGIAVQAAALSDDVLGVVAGSSFTALQDIANTAFGESGLVQFLLPLARVYAQAETGFRPDQVRPIDRISLVSPRPLLLVHGTADETVPVAKAERLYRAARAPKELWLVPGASHVGSRGTRPEEYDQRVGEFFDRAFGKPGTYKV